MIHVQRGDARISHSTYRGQYVFFFNFSVIATYLHVLSLELLNINRPPYYLVEHKTLGI